MSSPFAHGDVAEANRRQKAGALAATAWGMGLGSVLEHQRREVLADTEGVARASDLTWRLVDQLLADLDAGVPAPLELTPAKGDVDVEPDAPWWA